MSILCTFYVSYTGYFTSFFQQFLEVAPGKYVAPEEDIKEGSYDVTKNKKSEFSGEEETQTGIK